jgi:hypothetical protein
LTPPRTFFAPRDEECRRHSGFPDARRFIDQSKNMLRGAMRRAFFDPYVWAKVFVFMALSYLFLGHLVPGVLGIWQESHTISSLTISRAMRAELVESLADNVSRHYLDAAKGAQLAAVVREAERDGKYESFSSPSELARALTADMLDVTDDLHAGVEFSAAEVPDVGDRGIDLPPNDDVSLPEWLINRLGRTLANFGVHDVTQSESGIAYIRLTGFFRPFLAGEKYAAAMDRVAGSRALIIDLRENGGGKAESVALLASYFFEQPTHLSDIENPRTGERKEMWTSNEIEGTRYGSARPVYLLTSRNTFSAAEDFAYAMQTRKRAFIIGEVTKGGAHPVARFRLARHFIVHIPVAQSISPITHTNWEGKGVQPDVAVPASSALQVATIAILRQQLAVETDAARRARIQQWLRLAREEIK